MSTATDKKDLTTEMLATAKSQGSFKSSREAGIAAMNQLRMPGNKTEEYRFTPITRVLEKSFPQWPAPSASSPSIASVEQYLIPGLDANIVVLINGSFIPALSKVGNDGYTIEQLSKSEHDATVSGILGKQVEPGSDPFAAINTALWNEGVLIKAHNTSTKPLIILNINDGDARSVHNRVLVSIADGASISIVARTVTIGSLPVFQTLVEEISVGENGRFEFCKIQSEPNIIEVSNTSIHQQNSSHVNTFTLTVDGVLVRNNLSISIDGEKCESHFHGLSLLKGDTIGDHHTVVDHKKPNSFSNELYKGVMDGKSKSIFNGKIYVRPHAQKTNAFQSNRNILLSEQSSINTKPQLEIWADDVKCSHGCTTGQLDEEALFYLQSRGIGKDVARALLLNAFASQTTELITSQPLKAYIDSMISNRLHSFENQ
jgi:Fe-S cluster assembly protein SufD